MGEHFLGIGECMVELAPESPESPGLWRQGFAGDVFNTLWYARAFLGADDTVGFHTGLGSDALSAEFETFAAEHGIELGPSPRFDDRTLGLYAIHLREGERSFSYWRDTSAARRVAADGERLARRVASADLIYLSGITLAILPPEDLETLHAVLTEARAHRTIAFDPNIRPRLWANEAHMRTSIERVASLSHVVLPGVEDEALCFGAGTAEEIAARYVRFGAERVVVKDGGRGVTVRGDVHLDLPLEPIPVPLDTTGAGDAFAGAFLAGLLSGLDTKAAIRQGHRCAATVVMTRGALCPHERLRE